MKLTCVKRTLSIPNTKAGLIEFQFRQVSLYIQYQHKPDTKHLKTKTYTNRSLHYDPNN
jgi:hypothetical protein